MGIKDRQRDNLAQLQTMLREGTDDHGQPFSVEALENLTADIASLRALTGPVDMVDRPPVKDNDRTVHGTAADGGQIVRYDVAGKWFVEYGRRLMIPARHVTIGTAIRLALEDGADFHLGLPGGTRFDAGIRETLTLGVGQSYNDLERGEN